MRDGPVRIGPRSVAAIFALTLLIASNLVLKLWAAGTDGLWLDEALSLHVARAPVSLETLAANEPSPPLYYLLLCAWVRLFGSSIESARVLSVALSTTTALLLFDLGRRHFGLETAIVATALFTVSRLQLYYGHEARCYALVGLLCVASFDLFLALAARPTWSKAAALALINAALAYTHYVSILALVAQLAGAFLLAPSRGATFLVRYLASQSIAALLFLPQLWVVLRDGINQKDWIGQPTLGRAHYVMKRFAGSSGLLVLYGILGATTAWLRWRSPSLGRGAQCDRGKLAVLFLWALAPVFLAYAASFARGMLVDRYVLYASLGLYLLVAYVLALAPVGRAVRVAIASVAIVLSLNEALGHPIQRHDWRSAVDVVRAEQARGAVVVVAPDWHFRPLAYYLDPSAFGDFANTRTRLEARGIGFVEDPRFVSTSIRRQVLVLGPDVVPSARETEAWFASRGFRSVHKADLRGLTLLIVEPGSESAP